MTIPESLVNCRWCGHPWELHRSDAEELDLCAGTTMSKDGVCRCARVRPPTEEEFEESFESAEDR